MKKIFSLIVFFASVMMTYAQGQCVATLRKSDGTVSVYYGANAFVDAHSNAEAKGSVITLSSGMFHGTTIKKNITLRGAGMERDTIAKRESTIIYDYLSIQGTDSVTIEGIRYDGDVVVYEPNKNVIFLKSRINRIGSGTVGQSLENASFINCKITNELYIGSVKSALCVNSVLGGLQKQSSETELVCKNCVIRITKGHKIDGAYITGGQFEDCLTFSPYFLRSSNMISNSLGFGNADIFKNNTVPTSTYISDATTVFKTYTGGDIIDGETFELTEEAKSKYLGDDGTQVGIYGGIYPYNPTTTAPQIKKFDVARKSTAEGKLQVDIEVSAGAE